MVIPAWIETLVVDVLLAIVVFGVAAAVGIVAMLADIARGDRRSIYDKCGGKTYHFLSERRDRRCPPRR